MDLEKIRHSFSKGSMRVTDNGIDIIYMFKDRWFSQPVDVDVFIYLMINSQKMSIIREKDKYIIINFEGSYNLGGNAMYPPIKSELTKAEIQELIDKLELPSTELYELFKDVDFDNEDEVSEAFGKWQEMKFDDSYSFKAKDNLVNLVEISRKLQKEMMQKSVCPWCDVEEPMGEFHGCVDLTFSKDTNPVVNFDIEAMKMMYEMAGFSEDIVIEGYVIDGTINIGFYAVGQRR